jgi:branched-chain amino acid transport system permease protein
MVVQDVLAKDDPVFWLFWVGLILIAVVLFAPGGLLGLIEKVAGLRRPKAAELVEGQGQSPSGIEYRSPR